MTLVLATGRDGVQREVDALDGCSLMDTLTGMNGGVEGICGGVMSCGTCHVYVDPEWAAKLSSATADEREMLQAIGELVELRLGSRLSCQLKMEPALDGLRVTVAPAL